MIGRWKNRSFLPADWPGSSQGLVAMRDFNPAEHRFGSFLTLKRSEGAAALVRCSLDSSHRQPEGQHSHFVAQHCRVGRRALSGGDKRVGEFLRPVYHHIMAAGDVDELPVSIVLVAHAELLERRRPPAGGKNVHALRYLPATKC